MESTNKIPYKLICMACLASGNSTRIIIDNKLKRFYLDSLNENQPVYTEATLCLQVCWECEVLLKKVVSFQEQVKNSHNILQLFSVENLNEYLLTRSPRLSLKVNTPISIHPNERITKAWRLSSSTKELKDDLKVEWSDHGIGLTNLETLEHSIDLDDSVTELTVPVVSEGTDNDSLSENGYINAIEVEIEALVSKVKNKKRSRVSSKQKTVKKVAKKMRHRMKKLNECISKDVTRTPRLSRKVNSLISTHPKDEIRNARKFRSSSATELNNVLMVEWSDREDCSSNLETQENNLNLNNSLTDLTEPGQAGVTDEDSVSGNEYKHAIEVELETLVKKKRSKMVSKLKRSKTERSKKFDDQNILTIDLSYEEMLLERARESTRESYVNAEYKCDSCLMGFNYKKSFMAHQAAKHSSDRGECVCPICETVLPTVDSFTAHYKRHMRRYECGICQKRTMDIKVMQQHYYSTHEISLKEYKCNICGKISNSIDTHRYHKDTHKARVQCTECDKTFTHRAGLLNHRLAVHELNNDFPCTICDKVFRWKTSLRRHLDKHNVKDKSASAAYCSECGITFSSMGTYQRHMKNSLKHVTPEQLRYICDHCNRRFADKTKLRDHIEEKHLFKTYKCHICTKPFKNRVGLDQHVRNVHKRRPNNKMCHYCGKSFPTTVQLESHLRTHTGERPFSCEYCPTTFSQQSNLYKHKRQVHLNIKSKRYPVCKKRKEDRPVEPPLEIPMDPYRPVAVLHYPPESFVM